MIGGGVHGDTDGDGRGHGDIGCDGSGICAIDLVVMVI